MLYACLLVSLVATTLSYKRKPLNSEAKSVSEPRSENDDPKAPDDTTMYDTLSDTNQFYLVYLTKAANEDGALCLDGSTPIYYFRPGFGDGITKWSIFLQGGGWCAGFSDTTRISSSMQTCTGRAFGGSSRGTSNGDGPYLDENTGFFSTIESENPLLYNWNMVYIRYCDGASFSGNINNPIPVTFENESKNIYFRGHSILKGTLEDLFDSGRYGEETIPTDVLFHGSSAGGLAVYMNADYVIDYIQSFLNENGYKSLNTFGAMPVSGYFMEYESETNFVGGMQWIFDNQNVSYQLNSDCLSENSDNTYKCIFAQNLASHIKTRQFPLQSQYYSWNLEKILDDAINETVVNEYGLYLSESIRETVLNSKNKNENGLFLDSCFHHTYHTIETNEMFDDLIINDYSAAEALYMWYNNIDVSQTKNFWYQNEVYPCDACCPY